ncbi:PilZ domain-containing protein [Aureimonas psammosilenae]|uniref:PilZ domain-containing protein n=1 Tax=Aureimonas psammosilenae TaxID=2495496 RepID=UPI0012612188|nr:PilZ domain-containing protein [Aureimonas psammosilenae]
MQDRRAKQRRRVCLEGAVSNDLYHPSKPARIRNLSETGAEVVLNEILPPSGQIAFSLKREGGHIREATVVWQKDGRAGLRFASADNVDDEFSRLLRKRIV